MNKQKAISSLQSRIAKRRPEIAEFWDCYHKFEHKDDKFGVYCMAIYYGQEQRFDKTLLKMLQSPFDAGYGVGYQDACKAVKLTLEACECQH